MPANLDIKYFYHIVVILFTSLPGTKNNSKQHTNTKKERDTLKLSWERSSHHISEQVFNQFYHFCFSHTTAFSLQDW